MPELPEVEVLVRHLRRAVVGKTIRDVSVYRAKVLSPTTTRLFRHTLSGARFKGLTRRGKYLLFELKSKHRRETVKLLGHLGMTGRIYLARKKAMLPKHTAVVLDLGSARFVYEDTRYFGRLTLDTSPVAKLGPEPLNAAFDETHFARGLKRSRQAIKVKLLDQTLVAGIGNIYASEALFRARISPKASASKLGTEQVRRLFRAIPEVLRDAIACGSTVQLNYGNGPKWDGFFYFGRSADVPDFYEERLRVYDRERRPCPRCGSPIRRIVQAARSTFFCPTCQR
jgi:formamidopyrimidine-DNA glycosylase